MKIYKCFDYQGRLSDGSGDEKEHFYKPSSTQYPSPNLKVTVQAYDQIDALDIVMIDL